jgi:hypothetical protein
MREQILESLCCNAYWTKKCRFDSFTFNWNQMFRIFRSLPLACVLRKVNLVHTNPSYFSNKLRKTPWPESASELHLPSDRRLSAKSLPTFSERGCHVVSAADPLRPYSRFPRPEPLIFLSSISSIVLTRLSRPRSIPTTTQNIWQRLESNPDFWICNQELWPLDHRGGPHPSNIYFSVAILPASMSFK